MKSSIVYASLCVAAGCAVAPLAGCVAAEGVADSTAQESSADAVVRQCQSPRDAFVNPFSRESAHQRPIGTGARYADDRDPATVDWNRADSFGVNVGAPWGVSVAEADASDPVRTVGAGKAHCTRIVDLPVQVRLPRDGFFTNVVFNPKGCTDGVAVVFDRVSGVPHQLRQYDWNDGRPVAGQHLTWDIRGLGHGRRPGDRVGTSASGVAALFGLLRGEEMNPRGRRIEHALQMVLPRKPGCHQMLSREAILPAVSRDGSADAAGNNQGHIPYGGLLAIPRSVDLDRLDLSEAGRRLADAIQQYGIYAVDGGGCEGGAIRADQHVERDTLVDLKRDIPKFYRLIRLVQNSSMDSDVAGGGSPLAPNCAAF